MRARPVSASTVVVQWEEPLQPNGVVKVCHAFSLVIFGCIPALENDAWNQMAPICSQ